MKDFHGGDDGGSELELGLGLSLGGGSGGGLKLLTAQDLPSHGGRSVGAKRAADQEAAVSSSPPAPSQVVGWPPIRAHRMNSLASQTRPTGAEEGKMNNESDSKATKPTANEKTHPGFVKVNMDGVQIGRKVDLSAHSSYESLARAIEDMFFGRNSASVNSSGAEKDKKGKPSKLLDGSTEFVLTYEDKEGDWMLVGDVPFRMFQGTVRRLRIMRTSEANGLAPRIQERNDRPRSKPI